jgi:ribonuclease P protein component
MLPKEKRVTKEDFSVLLKEGKTFSTQLFLFYYIKSKTPKYAFVAPKNLFKKATKRNKYRRIGYNIIRIINLKQGTGVFIYKKQALNATQAEIKDNVLFIFKKFGFFE